MTANATRVCLLTGASGRLGASFCRLYGHRYQIAAVYRTQPLVPPPPMCWHIDPLDPGVRKRASEPAFAAIQADLTDPLEVSRVADFALDTFGRVDVLVNAAAVVHRAPLLSAEPTFADLSRMLDLNAVVPLRLAVELVRRFWSSRPEENAAMNRSVINISSTSGAYVFPDQGQGGYSASKAALNMLTCHMAEEFATLGVRVNSVAPDTFPQHVTTESVCDAIARLDAGALTGKMLLLEAGGQALI
jgi:NAD(P)-dependent dehydrogenase (short-subunit alcohol dehydrogenase family)